MPSRTPKELEYEKKVAENAREVLRAFRATTPCTDCGSIYPEYVMEFDHLEGRPNGRKRSISGHYYPQSIEKLLEIMELEKCELVCANCHRVRTHQRKEMNV